MDTPCSNFRAWYVPYFGAVAGIAIGYGGTMLISSQPSVAVGVAAMGALLGYLGARVVQMRGKLTMGLTAFGLPLLTGMLRNQLPGSWPSTRAGTLCIQRRYVLYQRIN